MPENTLSMHSVRELLGRRFGSDRVPRNFKIIHDTSDFFRVDYNDVIALGERHFWVKRYEKEGRFGLDDEPKFWVRRAVDLEDGSTKILKLVFHERFTTKVGGIPIECYRSPKKEARILDLVAKHENFMHGNWVLDSAGNIIRILDFIQGGPIDTIIADYGDDHEDYFYNYFPGVLDTYIELVSAIKFLHDNEEKHGDIRRDHILWDRNGQIYRWIDFDYDYRHGESMFSLDMLGLGNILIFLVGRGDVLVPELYTGQRDIYDGLSEEDLNISYRNRVANLKKVFPYIPETLNRVLLHFSWGAPIFYENTGQMLEGLDRARSDIGAITGKNG